MAIKDSLLVRKANFEKNEKAREELLWEGIEQIASVFKNKNAELVKSLEISMCSICDHIIEQEDEVVEIARDKGKRDLMLAWNLKKGNLSSKEYVKEIEKVREGIKQLDSPEFEAGIIALHELGENLDLRKVIGECLEKQDEEKLYWANNFVSEALFEVTFNEHMDLITKEHPQLLEKFIENCSNRSKMALSHAINSRKKMKETLTNLQTYPNNRHLERELMLFEDALFGYMITMMANDALIEKSLEAIKEQSKENTAKKSKK